MQAILVEHFGAEAMRAGELGMPEPARDEVLVRVLAAGVGPWYVEQRRGGWRGLVERGTPGEVVLIVDDDLAAALEV